MKKFLLSLLVVLMSLPAIAQTELVQDGVKYVLYNPEDGIPYAEINGNIFTENVDLVIPESVSKSGVNYPVTAIGYHAFYRCNYLISVIIGNSVQTIGDSAFSGCSDLTSVVIGNSVQTIGSSAFRLCSGLKEVIIGNSVQTIGDSAFRDCLGLTSVEIPNSVQTIGKAAFMGCSSLASVTIPNSVQTIGNSAFAKCSGLKEVKYNTIEPIAAAKSVFDDDTYNTATLNVAVGGLEKAKVTTPWSYFYNTKESDFTGIDEVFTDSDLNAAPAEVYNLNGMRIADSTDNLPAGLYIVRQAGKTQKISVTR